MLQNKIITISIIVIIFAFLLGYVEVQKSKIKALESEASNLRTRVELQNDAIEKNEIDLQKYKDGLKQVKERIVTNYKKIKIPVKDPSCEAKINGVEEALNVFFESPSN